jgi:hypothetical protein
MKHTPKLLYSIVTAVLVLSDASCAVCAERIDKPAERERGSNRQSAQMELGSVSALRAKFETKETTNPTQKNQNTNIQLKAGSEKPGSGNFGPENKKIAPPPPVAKQGSPTVSPAAKATEPRAKDAKPMTPAAAATLAPPKQTRLTAPEILPHDILVKMFSATIAPVPEKILTPYGLLVSHKVTDPVFNTYKALLNDNPLAIAVLDEMTPEEARSHNTLGPEFESIFAAYYLFTKEGTDGKRIPFPEDEATKNMRTQVRYARFLAAISRKK